jgi:hypothetical protein
VWLSRWENSRLDKLKGKRKEMVGMAVLEDHAASFRVYAFFTRTPVSLTIRQSF